MPVERPRRNEMHTISHRIPTLTKQLTVRSMTVTGTYVTATGTTGQGISYVFSLSDLDNYTAYTGLFDMYRIDCVVFKIIPMQNSITLQTNSTTVPVRLYCVVDYDDATNLTSEVNARGFDTCILVPPGQECSRTFQPRCAIAAYSGTFTSYANQGGQWIDCASPSVQHFGCKIYVPGDVAGQTLQQSWTIEREYYVSFKKVHG